MRKIFFILLFFLSKIIFSQENYQFDYNTVYEYKKDSLDFNPNIDIYYSNSKDNSYLLSIIKKNDTVFSAYLIDYIKQKIFTFKDDKIQNKNNDINLFSSYTVGSYNLENCRKSKKRYYEIKYDTIAVEKIIIINQYKNSRKKKLISQSFFKTKHTEITNNQHYNFRILVKPLWCEKFILKNNDLINYSYFIENDKKVHIRSLLEINKIDLNINVSSKNAKIDK